MKYKVSRYDDTQTDHEILALAIAEAAKRLESWREGTDRVVQQDFTPAEIEEGGLYVFVANECGQETDAGSYIEVVK